MIERLDRSRSIAVLAIILLALNLVATVAWQATVRDLQRANAELVRQAVLREQTQLDAAKWVQEIARIKGPTP